jgi:DNA-binding beta-propeller fold protein YncE
VISFDNLTGERLGSFGQPGSEDGQFNQVSNIAVDSQGRIFVADVGNDRIQVFDANGEHLNSWYQFGTPISVHIDSDDKLYVGSQFEEGPLGNFRRSEIRIASAVDGIVTEIIPEGPFWNRAIEPTPIIQMAVDQAGHLYSWGNDRANGEPELVKFSKFAGIQDRVN